MTPEDNSSGVRKLETMYAQTNLGMFGRCLNRECRKAFTKASHRGFYFKSPTEVFVVMECHECGQSFTLVQLVMLAHDFYRRLPVAPPNFTGMNEITAAEVRKARKMLDSDMALRMLSETVNLDSQHQQRDQ